MAEKGTHFEKLVIFIETSVKKQLQVKCWKQIVLKCSVCMCKRFSTKKLLNYKHFFAIPFSDCSPQNYDNLQAYKF